METNSTRKFTQYLAAEIWIPCRVFFHKVDRMINIGDLSTLLKFEYKPFQVEQRMGELG